MTPEEIISSPKFARQLELEETMQLQGAERFHRRVEEARENKLETREPGVRRLADHAIVKLETAIETFIAEANAKPGPRHHLVKYVSRLSPAEVALLTVQTVFDRLSAVQPYAVVARMLGQRLEDEVNSRVYQKAAKGSHGRGMKFAKSETRVGAKYRVLLKGAHFSGVPLEDWSIQDRIKLGMTLIDLLEESTGLIECENVHTAATAVKPQFRRQRMIAPSQRALEWIEKEHDALQWLMPVYLPTIVPPRPWTDPFTGAYWTRFGRQLTLVKTTRRDYLERLTDVEMPTVYTAINALQNTAWAINKPVLEAIEAVFEANKFDVPGVPPADARPLPQKPVHLLTEKPREEWTEDEVSGFKLWKAACREAREQTAMDKQRRLLFFETLRVAQMFADEEEIYFPHQLDWRGRAYPIVTKLSPQGPDLQRALLTFATTVPIHDEAAAEWLYIHGAGLWGVDKVSFEDRVQWVADREEEIIACAQDPISHRFWMTADKPWSALAFAFELKGFLEYGYGYESSLPIQMDGTCNGLQNFAAMLRDEEGGRATNLLPADRPSDIYQKVADRALVQVRKDAAEGHEFAVGWLPNLTRKVAKRPVMTLAYGATQYGFVDQIVTDTITPWRQDNPETYPFMAVHEETGLPMDRGLFAAQYLGKILWAATGEVVSSAVQAMEWLQEAAREATSHDNPLKWTSPAGLPVEQAYYKQREVLVETTFRATRRRVSFRQDTNKLDTKFQWKRVPPNFVHSLDAAHLQRTITRAVTEGISAFSMIHDSYGTHAGNAMALAHILREEFVRMYTSVDVMEQFHQSMMEQAPADAEIPLPPQKGTLDLNKVLESPFFFA